MPDLSRLLKAGDRDRTDDIQLGNAPGCRTETRKPRYSRGFRIASDAGFAANRVGLRAERGVGAVYTARQHRAVRGSSRTPRGPFRDTPSARL